MGSYIRIALRYLAGGLVAKGMFAPELAQQLANDPHVIQMVAEAVTQAVNWALVVGGATLAAVTEWVYAEAKKRGWAT